MYGNLYCFGIPTPPAMSRDLAGGYHAGLCDLIGLSEAEYRRLEADGIIGTIYTEDAT